MPDHESLVQVREELLEKLPMYERTHKEKMDHMRSYVARALWSYHAATSVQIDSFNNMMEDTLPRIIRDGNEIKSSQYPGAYRLVFGNLTIKDHPVREEDGKILFPTEAEQTSKTYFVNIYVAVEVHMADHVKKFGNKYLVSIPVMVCSKWCSLSTIPRKDYHKVGEDPMEQGGWFIINGSRKYITGQERSSFNGIYVFGQRKKPAYKYYAEIRNSATSGSRTSNVVVGYANDRVTVNIGDHQASLPIGLVFKALGVVDEDDIILLITPDKNYELIKHLTISLEDTFHYKTQRDAQLQVFSMVYKTVSAIHDKKREPKKLSEEESAQAMITMVNNLFQREFFSRQGMELSGLVKKAVFLGTVVNRLLNTKLGYHAVMDRDHFGEKSLDCTGDCIANKIYTYFTHVKNLCMNSCDESIKMKKETPNPLVHLKVDAITTQLMACLKNGIWTDPRKSGPEKTGISAQFDAINYQGAGALMCETSAQISTEGVLSKARHGHGSHDGIICPWQTVEGKNVGLKKGLALGSRVTIGEPSSVIFGLIRRMDAGQFGMYFIEDGFTLEEISFDECMEICDDVGEDHKPSISDSKLFVNGTWIALVRYALNFVEHIRALRRSNNINRDISIYYNKLYNEIIISTEIGRVIQPLFIVDRNGKPRATVETFEKVKREMEYKDLLKKYAKDDSYELFEKIERVRDEPRLDWDDLVSGSIIEYIDSREKENALIATHFDDVVAGKTTHVLVHPSLNISYAASTIPFPDHNQAPRNSYQSAHMKQFIGWPGVNIVNSDMTGSSSYYLTYAQKPLMSTLAGKNRLMVEERPTGQNPVIAIVNHLGFNQEDSQVFNKSAIERGMFKTVHYSKYHAIINTKQRMAIELPKPNSSKPEDWLDHLDDDGIPIVGKRIKKGDVIIPLTKITRVVEIDNKLETKKSDISILFKSDDYGQIDKVQLGVTPENYPFIRVRVVSIRNVEPGDKHASRHGQKGTVGAIRNQEDMPFTAEGIVPDMCITPLCIPSRMTLGHIVESCATKARCVRKPESFEEKPMIVRVKEKDGTRKHKKVMPLTPEEMSDATPYNREFSLDYYTQALEAAGYDPSGKEQMFDGMTGAAIGRPVYIGIVHYQRLKHMIEDKWHVRMNGSRTRLFRQASEGRNKSGGLRFGEINFFGLSHNKIVASLRHGRRHLQTAGTTCLRSLVPSLC